VYPRRNAARCEEASLLGSFFTKTMMYFHGTEKRRENYGDT